MPIRIVHTSNVHLDTSFAGAGLPPRAGTRLRRRLRDAFAQIIGRARTWPADAVLVAGGLFDLEFAMPETLAFIRREIETLGDTPVFVAPGSRDPALPESPYLRGFWPENVTVFRRPQWESLRAASGELAVHGFGLDAPDAGMPDLSGLAVADDGCVHVAICPVDGQSGATSGWAADAAHSHGLRYVALGGCRATGETVDGGGSAVWHSGAPMGRDFSRPGPHRYIEVEIDDGAVRVTPVAVSGAVFEEHTIDCSALAGERDLLDAIRSLPHAEGAARIVRVVLSGIRGGGWSPRPGIVRDALGENIEHFILQDDSGVGFEQDPPAASPFSGFTSRLDNEIRDTHDPARVRMLRRAREIGIAAFRGLKLPVPGDEKDV